MGPIQAANPSVSAPQVRAKTGSTDASSSLFATLLGSVQQTLDRPVGPMTVAAGDRGSSARRIQRLSEALSRTRQDDLGSYPSKVTLSRSTSRVDRLKSLAHDQERNLKQVERSSSLRQRARRRQGLDRQTNKQADVRSADGSHAGQKARVADTTEGSGSLQEVRKQQVLEARAEVGRSGAGASSSADAGNASASGAVHQASPGGPFGPDARPPEFSGVLLSGRTGAAPAFDASSGEASTRDTGPGPSGQSTQLHAARAGESAGKAGPSVIDFQSLLDHTSGKSVRAQGPGNLFSSGLNAKPRLAGGVDLGEPKAVNELASIVRANIGTRHSTMILRLDPPELGQLRIDIRMHDEVLTLRLQAQTQAGQEALQGRLTQLREALEHHGIQINQIEVELKPTTPSQEPQGQKSDDPRSQQNETTTGDSSGRTGDGFSDVEHGSASQREEQNPQLNQNDTLDELGRNGQDPSAEAGVDLIV